MTVYPLILLELYGTGKPLEDATDVWFSYEQLLKQDPRIIVAWAELLSLEGANTRDLTPCYMKILDNNLNCHVNGMPCFKVEYIDKVGQMIVGIDLGYKKPRKGAEASTTGKASTAGKVTIAGHASTAAGEARRREQMRYMYMAPELIRYYKAKEKENAEDEYEEVIRPDNPDGLPLHMNFKGDYLTAQVDEEDEEQDDVDEFGAAPPTDLSRKWDYQDRRNALFNGRFPLEMFPQPVDDYHPPCVSSEPVKTPKRRSLRRRKSTSFARANGAENSDEEDFAEPKVEFKYPDREPSSPRWLSKMLDQLKKDRREVEDSMEDALKEMKDLTYEAHALKLAYNAECEGYKETMATMKQILPNYAYDNMVKWIEKKRADDDKNAFEMRCDDKYDLLKWTPLPSPGLGNALGFSGPPAGDPPQDAPASAARGSNVAGSSKLPQQHPAASRSPPADRPSSSLARSESPVEESQPFVQPPVFRPPPKVDQEKIADSAAAGSSSLPSEKQAQPSIFSSLWHPVPEKSAEPLPPAPRPLSPVADAYPPIPDVALEDLYNGGSVSAKVPLGENRSSSSSDSSTSSSESTSSSDSDSSSDSSDSSSESDSKPPRKEGKARSGSCSSKRSRDDEDEDEEPESPPKRARSAEFKAPQNSHSGPASGNRQHDSAESSSKRAREEDSDELESPVKRARNEFKIPGTPFRTPMRARRPRADSPAVSVSASRNRAFQAEVESEYCDSPTESEIEVENSALYGASDESVNSNSDILPDTSGMRHDFFLGSSPKKSSDNDSDSDYSDTGILRGFPPARRRSPKKDLDNPDNGSARAPATSKGFTPSGGWFTDENPCGPYFPVRSPLVTPLNLEFERIEENYNSEEDSDYSPPSDDASGSSNDESVCSDFLPADNESVSSIDPDDGIAARRFKEKGRKLHLISYDLGYSAKSDTWEESSCTHMPPAPDMSRKFAEWDQYPLLEHQHIRFSEKYNPGNALVPPDQVRKMPQPLKRHQRVFFKGADGKTAIRDEANPPEHVLKFRNELRDELEQRNLRHAQNQGKYEDDIIDYIMTEQFPFCAFENEDGTVEEAYHNYEDDVLEQGPLRVEGGGSSRNHY